MKKASFICGNLNASMKLLKTLKRMKTMALRKMAQCAKNKSAGARMMSMAVTTDAITARKLISLIPHFTHI